MVRGGFALADERRFSVGGLPHIAGTAARRL
jgi:hypothetical protein